MNSDWYVQVMGEELGPLSDRELRELARSNRITPDALIRRGESNRWVTADRVRGLFHSTRSSTDSNQEKSQTVEQVVPAVRARPQSPPTSVSLVSRVCPFCAEEINWQALKCKHCGEFLDESLTQDGRSIRRGNSAIQPHYNLGVAAVLSLVIPGAGQMYKGNVGTGFAWLVGVAVGYAMLIVPGLVLHLICVVNAASHQEGNVGADRSSSSSSSSRIVLYGGAILLVVLVIVLNGTSNSRHSSPATRPSSPSSAVPNVGQGSNSGPLLDKTALDWQIASYDKKLSTCEDMIASAWLARILTPEMQRSLNSTTELKRRAAQLVDFIDSQTPQLSNAELNRQKYADQTVRRLGALGCSELGWVKL